MHRNLYLLYKNQEVKTVLTPGLIVSYRSARKTSSYLVRTKLYPLERRVGSEKCGKSRCEVCLKLVSAIFLSSFHFTPNDSPLKIMKNVFYFIQKAPFVLEIFKFLYFHLPLFSPLSAIALEVDRR